MSVKTIVVTGASSGFGAMTVRELARAGHRVYAGMRNISDRNQAAAAEARGFAEVEGVDLRPLEMDVSDDASVTTAVDLVIAESGDIDVVVHNAGHLVVGPTEAFSTGEIARVYDTNVLSTQRVNRAVLPGMRERGSGLLVWVGSSSTRGGTPPYLAPYFAAKAAEDALAVSYAAELVRFGIDTVIVVPGSFTSGTHHFANAGAPADAATAVAYEQRYAGLIDRVGEALAELAPPDADPSLVATELARVVDLEPGTRPFRVHVDPADDGSKAVSAVADRVRREFFRRIRMEDLLSVRNH